MDNRDPEIPVEPVTSPHLKQITIEESNENVTSPNESTTLINNKTGISTPSTKPENDLEEVNGIPISQPKDIDELLNQEREDDKPVLSDKAGFPYAPEFGPGVISPVPNSPESPTDLNLYQQKKTVAQGMMDLALFSANTNQLRYVLDSSKHSYYYSGIVLITLSLILQVAIGASLLWNTKYDVKDEKEVYLANRVNNFTTVAIFLVTVINVFISAFGTTTK